VGSRAKVKVECQDVEDEYKGDCPLEDSYKELKVSRVDMSGCADVPAILLWLLYMVMPNAMLSPISTTTMIILARYDQVNPLAVCKG
jgi:hypothetical protein